MKRCSTCKTQKPMNEFNKNRTRNDGLCYQCRDCQKETSKKYKQSKKGQTVQKRYEKSENGKEARRRAVKKYKQSENGKTKRKGEDKRRREKYPQKIKARVAISHAVVGKKIPSISSLRCANCGQNADQYHHYKGYERDNWLKVIPLCRSCHTKEHNS